MAAATAAQELLAKAARMAAAPVAQEPQAEPAQGVGGALRPAKARHALMPDWDSVPDLLGGKTLPVVLDVLRWLN